MTRHWFDTKQWTFEHLIKVIQSEYSPIENVFEDRTESTDYNSKNITSGGYTDTASGKDTEQLSGSDERDISNSGTDTTTNTISAFNSAAYQPDNRSETTHGHGVDDDITYGRKTDTTYGKQIRRVNDETASKTGKDTLSVNRHGNIGVTTSQHLINEELELLRHFDIYSYIAKLFEEDMFIMIY
jgi:hypothetical protein